MTYADLARAVSLSSHGVGGFLPKRDTTPQDLRLDLRVTRRAFMDAIEDQHLNNLGIVLEVRAWVRNEWAILGELADVTTDSWDLWNCVMEERLDRNHHCMLTAAPELRELPMPMPRPQVEDKHVVYEDEWLGNTAVLAALSEAHLSSRILPLWCDPLDPFVQDDTDREPDQKHVQAGPRVILAVVGIPEVVRVVNQPNTPTRVEILEHAR
jgi:hypothetical protein